MGNCCTCVTTTKQHEVTMDRANTINKKHKIKRQEQSSSNNGDT